MYPAPLNNLPYLYDDGLPGRMAGERSSDVPLAPVMSFLLFTLWAALCLVGVAIIILARQTVAGAILIAVPTVIGMVLKPTFALCMLMLILPTGAGVGFGGTLSLDRLAGLAVAVSFFINVMMTQPGLHVRHRAVWCMVIYTVWIVLASLAGPAFSQEIMRAFTQVQLLILMFIVYWILETNGEATFRWALRSFVVGTLGTIGLALVTGAAIRASHETGDARFSATLGNAIDANMLAALTSLAFLADVYLLARDRNRLFRLIYVMGLLILPVMLLRIGSRGALVALAFTVMSPLLFVRQVARRPALAGLLLVAMALGALGAGFLVTSGGLDRSVSQRLTDVGYAQDSIRVRLEPIQAAVSAVMRRPIGTGFTGWFEQTGALLFPHNDFFFMLGVYGFLGALLFALLILSMIGAVKRTPLGLEKFYSRAVLTFLMVMGLNIGQVFKKYYWISLALVLAAERIGRLTQADGLNDNRYYEESDPASPDDQSYVS